MSVRLEKAFKAIKCDSKFANFISISIRRKHYIQNELSSDSERLKALRQLG